MEDNGKESLFRELHTPALLEEVIHFLEPTPGKIIIDATIDGGGHAEEILRRITPGGLLIGIDRDTEALEIVHERLKSLRGNFKLINKNFKDLRKILSDLGIEKVDGILFDLGLSSIQIETKERGFSIKHDAPLDMRMDRSGKLTAKDIVNNFSREELSRLIRDFGEERFHRRIAEAIVAARKNKEIRTTRELAEVICNSLPYRKRLQRIHPATRTFQALRIRVNEELRALEAALTQLPDILKEGGRVLVISFHSLEDRIAKNVFRELHKKGIFRIITKKVVRPQRCEVLKNPRARSARLRVATKLTQ